MELISARKDRQREALVEAAERAIAGDGLAGLKARQLASEIGVALGAIYNLVEDLDELYLRVASRTLARLDDALALASNRAVSPAVSSAGPAGASDSLVAIALGYRAFASANLYLWRSLFEHRMAPGKPLPQWAESDQMRLFRHILAPLERLTPQADDTARLRVAQTLFSAVHGIVLLGLEEKFVGVPPALLDQQIEAFVRTYCKGAVLG